MRDKDTKKNPNSNNFDEGHITLSRKILNNKYYFAERFTKSQAWIDLLLIANFNDNFFFVRGVCVNVRRGQIAYSQTTLAQRWHWSVGKVNRFLFALQMDGQISLQNNNITTLITILNFDQPEKIGDQIDDQAERRISFSVSKMNEQIGAQNTSVLPSQSEHNNKPCEKTVVQTEAQTERKSGKNGGHIDYTNNKIVCIPPPQNELTEYFREKGESNPEFEAKKFFDYNQSRGWMVGKNKMKDWKAGVRYWISNKPVKENQTANEPIKQLGYGYKTAAN